MISSQVIATSIEELRAITRVELCVYDPDGTTVASTFDNKDIEAGLIRSFVESPADSQVIGFDHLLKIMDEGPFDVALSSAGTELLDTYFSACVD